MCKGSWIIVLAQPTKNCFSTKKTCQYFSPFLYSTLPTHPRVVAKSKYTIMQKNMIKFFSAAAESLQSCLTLCDPMDCSLPGFSVHGILQVRTLEWVAISFSNAWKWKVKVKSLSHVWLLATPWTAAYQAPPSMGFSRQKYWSGVALPSP